MRFIPIIFLLFVFTATVRPVQAANSAAIAAVVNADAISVSDVHDRMHMLIVSSGLPQTPEFKEKMYPQVLNALIDEQLKLQEAGKQDITISDKEIEAGFEDIAKQNNLPIPQFEAMIKNAGINRKTMEAQIRAQLSWNKIIQKRIRPQVNISESDIDTYLERLEQNAGKTQYLVGEIYLPVDSPGNEQEVKALADRLSSEIRGGKVPFPRVAQQFSQAPGAAQGGALGWIQEGQLEPELDETLRTLQPNNVSNPIRTADGYNLLFLREVRALTPENLPNREQVMQRLGIERMDRQQRRYLMDLRAAAFIDTRMSAENSEVRGTKS
ncbi:MAG: peptidylprolyl isomerase [Alphaproteobacteria bacterium]|nr:peptidylprolyl isomerase [Alphaproteobacteria bacterium]